MPAELAKKLLHERSYQVPREAVDADDLLALVRETGTVDSRKWYAAINDADSRTLIAAIGGMSANPPIRAYREAARAMVEQKLTEQMIERMEALERASTRLGRIGIGVALVIGAAGVLVAL